MKLRLTIALSAAAFLMGLPALASARGVAPAPARAERILLVQGTTSTPNAREKRFAEAVTGRLSRWLSEMGIEHERTSDDRIASGIAPDARVVILGYNPFPDERMLSALGSVVAGGAKLLVFYSACPRLAEMVGMELGPYKRAETGRWGTMRFQDSAAPHWPRAVRQSSRNIRAALPTEASRILAVWHTESGQTTGDPAVTVSDRAFWISHVLLDDGDTWSKKRMLLAMVGAAEPAVWRPAAETCLRAAAGMGRYADLQSSLRHIRMHTHEDRTERVKPLLDQAVAQYTALGRLLEQGRYAEVVEGCGDLADLLAQAYGSAQRGAKGEMRAIWDHSGTGLYPGDWPRTCRILAQAGFTDLMPNMVWPGVAHYPSDPLRESEEFALYGDQLAQCLAAAHRHGIRVHVWKVCWRIERLPEQSVRDLRRQGRLQVSDAGKPLDWLCPSHPDNLRMEKDAIREILRNYPVDGIHLDYVRYNDARACYCAGCRSRFEAQLGHRLPQWPGEARYGGKHWPEFSRWRNEQITRLIRDVHAFMGNMNPRARLSVAVYGRYPLCATSVGQDWGAWLKDGIVHFVYPMNYTTDFGLFQTLVQTQARMPNATGRILPGIGVTATQSQLSAVDVIEQIGTVREQGLTGFAIFELNRKLETEILPVLNLGLTANP